MNLGDRDSPPSLQDGDPFYESTIHGPDAKRARRGGDTALAIQCLQEQFKNIRRVPVLNFPRPHFVRYLNGHGILTLMSILQDVGKNSTAQGSKAQCFNTNANQASPDPNKVFRFAISPLDICRELGFGEAKEWRHCIHSGYPLTYRFEDENGRRICCPPEHSLWKSQGSRFPQFAGGNFLELADEPIRSNSSTQKSESQFEIDEETGYVVS